MRRLASLVLAASIAPACVAAHESPDVEVVTVPVLPPTDEVDLLFVIDDAGSVIAQQLNLAAAMPALLGALTSGDHDGDRVAERRAVRSLHVGFVTSDLGLGDRASDEPVGPCSARGDDAVLRTRTSGALGCEREFPARTFAWEAGSDLDAFAADLACMARMGKGGCTHEQLLEAALEALSPAEPQPWVREDYVPPTFHRGERGHGDTVNGGFLRAASVLAFVPFADDEDGSTPRYDLYWGSTPELAMDPIFLRRSRHPDALHPLSRYVEGLLQLRAHPGRLVFASCAAGPRADRRPEHPSAYLSAHPAGPVRRVVWKTG